MAGTVALDTDDEAPFATGLANGVLTIGFSAPPAHPLSSKMIDLLREELERVANRPSGESDHAGAFRKDILFRARPEGNAGAP